MAIANLTKEIALALDSDFLGLPVNHNISNSGYWYTYHPSDFDSNNVLANNSACFYYWDSQVSINSSYALAGGPINRVKMDGSIAFIDEVQNDGLANQNNVQTGNFHNGNVDYARYHGGGIIHIGSGTHDITGVVENDALFFSHLGTFGDDNTSISGPAGGSLEDDAFYWDRLYQRTSGGQWEYDQYHQHLPSNYNKFDDGRIVFDGDGYIREADKQFGYLITTRVSTGNNSYSVPLARIHTPSVGGAHNSHNDVTLPNTAGINYLPGGIIKGSSNRFHAFYLTAAADSEWSVYSRTYTSSSGAFTPEVSYGDYDLANATFNPYEGGDKDAEGSQSKYAMRVSAGHTFGSKVFIPVIMKAVTRSYTAEVEAIVGGGVVYQIGNTTREGTFTGRQQPTIELKVGDTLTFDVGIYNAAHPLYIQTTTSLGAPSADQAAGSSGGGTSTVTFTPQSAGTYYYICSVHSNMYGQINVTNLEGSFDQQIWNVTDANTISPGTLSRVDLPQPFQGTNYRPDTMLTSVGSRLYAAIGGSSWKGGVQLYSSTTGDSTNAWTLEGNIVSNDSDQPLRVHGFKYNANTTKFFTLISGIDGSLGNYDGKGLYSFDLAGGAFDGYNHLDYDPTSGTFETNGPLQAGHISYSHVTGTLTHNTGTEPEGIPAGTSIMQYDVASPNFFNRKEINTGAEEYFFQGIYLQDGRKCLVGRVEKWFEDGIAQIDGNINSGDLIMTIVDNENNSVSYVAGGSGDDFITGVIEDIENDRIVFSGYAKGELTNKGEQWVHGWGRNVNQSTTSAKMRFNDVVLDSDGYIVSGIDDSSNHGMLFRYDKDYVLTSTKYLSQGADSSGINTVDKFADRSYVVSGYTHNGTLRRHGYIAKLDSNDNVDWSLRLNQGNNYHDVTSHCIVSNGGTEYIVAFMSNNTQAQDSDAPGVEFSDKGHGILMVLDKNGTIISSKSTENIYQGAQSNKGNFGIKRLRAGRPNTGEFLFAGHSNYTSAYYAPIWGYGDIDEPSLVKLIHGPAAGRKTNVSDFENTSYNPESMFNDIRLLNYDSDLKKYEIVVVGMVEDVSLANNTGSAVSQGMGNTHESFPLAAKYSFIDSTTHHNIGIEWEKSYTSAYGSAEELTTCIIEDSDQRDWWFNETEFFHNNVKRIIISGRGINLDGNAAHPDYTADILMGRDTFLLQINDNDGSVAWNNSLGHMGEDDINKGMCWDAHDRNFVTVGSSTSHSVGQDGVLFRLWKDGFGQGVYNTAQSTSNAYYYDSAGMFVATAPTHYTDFSALDSSSYPPLFATTVTSNTLSSTATDQTVNPLDYNGAYGANGLFTGFLGWVNKSDLQSFKNTDEYRIRDQEGKIIHRADNIFNIRQISTVGDATADDGNIFGYDVIKSSDGEYYYMACQTSGNVAQQNPGQSGVYDYMLAQYDIASDQFRFWQAGTEDDEEIYALTELQGTAKTVTNPEAVNNGAGKGTVSWTPDETGTYFYQCGNHGVMNGQLVVQAATTPQTFNITVLYTNTPNAFRFSGTDRAGAINSSADNPTITINKSDTVNFIVNNTGHPFWIQTETGTGGAKKGHIAFCGRSTGNLGGHSNIGGYDIFTGIFDPRNWEAEYYQIGSGFNDKAMNIHDINSKIPNTYAVVYTSFGAVNGSQTFGSEDIGVITFNYDTDTWSQGFQTGSETSEEIDQNGKPSTFTNDGRVGVVCNTSGAFADNANTFGLLDMGLGIFDFDSDGAGNYLGWRKYQVGSGSSDFSFSIDNNGTSFLLTGYSEATWDKAVSGVFVEFDPERNLLAKSAG